MKTNFKKMIGLMILALTTVACSPTSNDRSRVSDGNEAGLVAGTILENKDTVTLISRYTGGTYTTASYSFRFMSQDINLTRNNHEILFEAREDFADYFQVNTVVDDNSHIYDLGNRSCADITSSYPEDRKSRPLVWLAYSDADPSDMEAKSKALVQQGHCYLTYNSDEDGRVVTLFHVKEHTKSKSVVIDEIEVLDVLVRKN